MKPRTREEKRVYALAQKLRPLTERQEQWANNNTFPLVATATKKRCFCLHCGNEWQHAGIDTKTVICPHCGKRLKVEFSRKQILKWYSYFCITQHKTEYQVFRYFYIELYCRKGNKPSLYNKEVFQHWYNTKNEKNTIMARNKRIFSSWQEQPFDLSSDLSIKHEHRSYYSPYSITPSATFAISIDPELRKRGFCGELCGQDPKPFFYKLLHSSAHETLLKAKQYKAFAFLPIGYINDYWHSLKIVMRHKYKITDIHLWCDLIKALETCQADTHNPKFVCPQNLKAMHDLWCNRAEVIRRKEREREAMKRAKEQEQAFIEAKQKYFDIFIKGKNLSISVLKSVSEFQQEGKEMHHCVFSNAYYLKDKSLILSACDSEQHRLATIELSLENFKVIQCRAKCNKIPERDKQIRNLLKRNINLFKRATA